MIVAAAFRQLAAFITRRRHGVPPPSTWMLEVTNRCNLSCPMCPRESVSFVRRDMDLTLIRRLIDQNPGLQSLWPYGYGESLMHPEIFEVIRYAREKGIVVSLSTNATLLTPDNARRLLESGLEYLILAIDGATAATYERYRYGARYERVVSNIEAFLELKNATKAATHVTVQMIRMDGNEGELHRFRTLWRRKGVNRVRIRRDLTRRHESHASQPFARRRPCFFLWRGPAFVQASGVLLPCPYYHGAEPFGDLSTQSMAEAWNSERMTDLRQAHVRGDLTDYPICAACPRYQPNPVVAGLSFFATTGGIRRWLPLIENVQDRTGVTVFE